MRATIKTGKLINITAASNFNYSLCTIFSCTRGKYAFFPYFNATTAFVLVGQCCVYAKIRVTYLINHSILVHIPPGEKCENRSYNYNALLSLRVRASVKFLNKCQAAKCYEELCKTREKFIKMCTCQNVKFNKIHRRSKEQFDMKTFYVELN